MLNAVLVKTIIKWMNMTNVNTKSAMMDTFTIPNTTTADHVNKVLNNVMDLMNARNAILIRK